MAVHQYYVGVNPKGGYVAVMDRLRLTGPELDGYPYTVDKIHQAKLWDCPIKALKYFELFPGYRLMKCSIVIEE